MPEKLARAVRYSLVSVVSIVISQAVLVLSFGFGHLPARTSNVLACIIATGPSYYLNRNWAWGRRGKSNLWREVVPFWALAFLGWGLSTWAADLTSSIAHRSQLSHMVTAILINMAVLTTFGTLWVSKFVIFNALLFSDHSRTNNWSQHDDLQHGSSEGPIPVKQLNEQGIVRQLTPTGNK